MITFFSLCTCMKMVSAWEIEVHRAKRKGNCMEGTAKWQHGKEFEADRCFMLASGIVLRATL